jgi:type II secretory pathway pseudopilin PulG
MSPRERRPSEAGMSLVALFAAMSVMFIMMGAAVPAWRYVMKDAREEELLFRGGQIADAIQRYQEKNKTPPPSLEIMVQRRFLRKVYRDPFAKDGKWRFIRQGEQLLPPGVPGPGGPTASPTPQPSRRDGQTGDGQQGSGQPQLGGAPFIGVASFSKDKSLRIMNGRTRYNEWLFIAGQPRLMGRQLGVVPPVPGASPSPKAGSAGPAGGSAGSGPGIRKPDR